MWVILTVKLEIKTFISKILSVSLLRCCTWRLLHIFRADQTYMVPMHNWDILTFGPSTLKPWSWQFCPGNCSETVNGNSFIFYGHINLTWDLCTVILTFWPLSLKLWPLTSNILLTNSCSTQLMIFSRNLLNYLVFVFFFNAILGIYLLKYSLVVWNCVFQCKCLSKFTSVISDKYGGDSNTIFLHQNPQDLPFLPTLGRYNDGCIITPDQAPFHFCIAKCCWWLLWC